MAQQKSFILNGKRIKLLPEVPAQSIRWLVGKHHVSQFDAVIVADIEKRALANAWPAKAIENAKQYAIYCHHMNRKLYDAVMSGHFNPVKRRAQP